MAVIALAGGLGAPGVTTVSMALLLTWPLSEGLRMVLAECDPDGGAVLPGALQGTMEADRGLRNLALVGRRDPHALVEAFWRQLIDITEDATRDRLVLPGLYDPAHAASMDVVWGQLAKLFVRIEDSGHDVLVDLGRRGATGPAGVLAQRSDVVLMVVRNTLRGLQSAEVRLAALRERLGTAHPMGVVVVEAGPFSRRDVEKHLKEEVVAALPFRPEQAVVLSDGSPQPRRFETGELMRTVRTATPRLMQMVASARGRLARPEEARPEGARPEVSGAR